MTPQGKALIIEQAERFARLTRLQIARLRADGYDTWSIAAELDIPYQLVQLVLSEPRPIRKCRP